MKVLILAGGFATRLWPLSERHAKPLLLLGGRTILAHILEKIPTQTETILLTNQKFESGFRQELKQLGREKVQIFCEDSHSDGEKLGALGAIAAAIKELKIDEDILIFAGDNLLPSLRIEQLFCDKREAKIAVREVATLHEARKFGVVKMQENIVKNFEEKPTAPRSKIISTGFMMIGRTLLPILCEFAKKHPDALGGIFPELLKRGIRVTAEKIPGEWFDVGSFETYLQAHRALQKKPLVIAKNASEKKNRFSGKVFIGDGSTVENCQITDSVVYPHTVLRDCVISQTIIDENCNLTGLDLNQKLVRAGTRLHADNK